MAVERQEQIFSLPLGQFLPQQARNFQLQRKSFRARQEADFLRKVDDEGITTEEQIDFRKKMLEAEEGKRFPDTTYIRELKQGLTSLRKLKRAEKFRDAYLESFNELKTSKRSIDDHISFLEEQLGSATDQDLKTLIEDKRSEALTDRHNIQSNILTNKVQFAIADKTRSVLGDTIDKVSKRRNEALVGGNEEEVGMWDLSLQILGKSLKQVDIQDKFHELEVRVETQGQLGAEDYLNFFNTNLSGASSALEAFDYNGRRYASEKDFWGTQLNSYLTDQQNGFFPILENEFKNDIAEANNMLSPILKARLAEVDDKMIKLGRYQVLQPFVEQLERMRQNVLLDGVDKLGAKVTEDYFKGTLGNTAKENIQNSINTLNDLNSKYNVDVSTHLNTVIQDVQDKKTAATQTLISDYYNILNDKDSGAFGNDTLAFSMASQNARAYEIPTNEILGQSVSEIARGLISGAPEADISQGIEVEKPTPKSQPSTIPEGELVKTADSPTVFLSRGNKLLEFAGAFDEASFREVVKRETGKDVGFEAVKTIESTAGQQIQQGAFTPPPPPPEPVKPKESNVPAPLRSTGSGNKPIFDTKTKAQTTPPPIEQPDRKNFDEAGNLILPSGQKISPKDPNFATFKKQQGLA